MKIIGILGAFWGALGVISFISFAVYRLFPIAWNTFEYNLLWYHYVVLFLNIIFMAYKEGYQGFQKKFSPRVAARVKYLSKTTELKLIFLAPIFCMAYFRAPKKTKIATISLTAVIICLIIILRYIPDPWRGICDWGVVVGLTWGIASLLFFIVYAFSSAKFSFSPEVE